MHQISMFHPLNSRQHTNVFYIGVLKGKHGKSMVKGGISSTYCDINAQTWTEKAGYINIRWKHRVG